MPTMHYEPQTYTSLKTRLGNRSTVRLAPNTTAELHSDDTISVRFHWTNILTFCPDGRVILRSGGYETVTTKARLNRFLPTGYQIFQKDFVWTLSTPTGEQPFQNGMEVTLG